MHLQPAGRGAPSARHGGAGIVDRHIPEGDKMPDISLPELHLPDVKLPEGLRDMNRKDIQEAIGDRVPKKVELPDIDLSKVELPKAVTDRLPGRKRTNPILPIAAFLAIGSLIAAAWWLITSPTAALRVRETAERIRSKVSGSETAIERYEDDTHLGSLLPDESRTRPSVEAETWPDPDSYAGVGQASGTSQPVAAGNGAGTERTSGV
jgi:hypothetical protein